MSEHNLTQSHHGALCRRIFGHIGRLLKNVHGLKMGPHRVCGIGQTSLCKSVRGKQITEFIVNLRHRNALKVRNKPTAEECEKSDEQHGRFLTIRQDSHAF